MIINRSYGSIFQNNRQNRKSQNQPSNMSEFSKELFSHFSVHKLQRISKLIVTNSHLVLKSAITSSCDVTCVVLNTSFTDANLRQSRSKKISCSCSGSFKSTECRYRRFLINFNL